jgi:CHAT domain-containing protein/Tfp pilus assembly protein PilF
MKWALLSVIVAAVVLAGAAPSALPDALDLPGDAALRTHALERTIAPAAHQRYRVRLGANEIVSLQVAQQSTDVVVDTIGPDGRVIARFDDEPGARGEERVAVVSGDRPGTYTIAVAAAPASRRGGSYTIHLNERRPATDADRRWQDAMRLRADARRLTDAARLAEAQTLIAQAAPIVAAARGSDSADAGFALLQAAGIALRLRDDRRAREAADAALAIFDCSDDLHAARARALLAVVQEHEGDGAAAEAVLQPALAAIRFTLGAEHPWYIDGLTTESNIRFDAGDFDAAEALVRQAMTVVEKRGDTQGLLYATLLNNAGRVQQQRGDNEGAEPYFLRALGLYEQVDGPRSYRVSTTLQNLGIVARQRGDYGRALDYDVRALFMREDLLGPEHAEIAPLLNNLAVLYRSVGDETHALPMLFRALAIRERTVGAYHRGTLNTVGNIARSYTTVGDLPHALQFERRADEIVEQQLTLNLAAGSERQKLAFARSVADRTDRTLSLHLNRMPGDAGAAALAALVLLQRKGRVQDAMADVFSAVRRRMRQPADRFALDRLNDARRELARLALEGSAAADAGARLSSLQTEAERLETSLSRGVAEFRDQMQPVSLPEVQQSLPGDSALIEYAVFRPFHPEAARREQEYDAAHYAAYVIRREGRVRGFDLGDAAAIDHAVSAFRNAVRDPSVPEPRVKTLAANLSRLVIQPLEAALPDVTRLVISPDGHLNLIPFEALTGRDSRYLIERFAVSYVTSGRDLLRVGLPPASTDAVIFADPQFGGVPAHLAPVRFGPLPGTGAEAAAIHRLFPQAEVFTGSAATKDNLRSVRAPKILHIASHAYFDDGRASGASSNPLLRSGLALAGANAGPGRAADGVLTALEASGLDLWGTELVTLSACDTGVGEIRNGEGVYGLRRAFVLAGAQTLVMSLWNVSDFVARDTMVAYYAALGSGKGRGDGLRQVKLAMLRSNGRQHPYYWAGFIQSGTWTPLVNVPARPRTTAAAAAAG